MPKELISAFEVLWQTAMEHAQNQLTEYKQVIESDREKALQKEKEAEKAVSNLQLKLEKLSSTLEQETINKQEIAIELAVANDRLIKQDETFAAQKNQYEDILKRVYEENENLIKEYHRLQIEIKNLHEKLAAQAEEHKQLLAQQRSLQEQSEMRWLNLIDQARLETKEERKKLNNLYRQQDEQSKKFQSQLSNAQREIHEKDAQLNTTQERIIQLRQEVKFLETEYIKVRATIMKFEEEQKQKTLSHSSKKLKKGERQLNKETSIQG